MPASLNCQYSNSRNVEFLYSSNVANPCSVDMATTTMPLLIALFGSLVMMTWNVSWSPLFPNYALCFCGLIIPEIMPAYLATIINIIVSQAITHANFYQHVSFLILVTWPFFPRACTFTSIASVSCRLVVVQLFRSASSCPYRKDCLFSDKICNSPWLVNQLAAVERVRTARGWKQCWFCLFWKLTTTFLPRCFGIFPTISDIVFKADILPTDNFFERQVSCASLTLSVSAEAAAPIGYQIRVLEAIGAA